MQRQRRLAWMLGLAFVLGAAVSVVWMIAILRVPDNPDVPVNMAMKVTMFLTSPPFLLSYATGGRLVYSVPVLNGLLYAAIVWLWMTSKTAAQRVR